MTRIINTRSGAEEIGVNPVPRSELRSYLYTAARDSYQDYEACPWWRPLRRAYLRGLSEALYDAWSTYAETEKHEQVSEVLDELGRNARKESVTANRLMHGPGSRSGMDAHFRHEA